MERKQKTEESFLQRDRSETEGYAGARTSIGMVANEFVEVQLSATRMLEYILTPDNLNRAYKQVVGNRGSGGTDSMEVEELLPWLHDHKDELVSKLERGRYRPHPVRRVEIPKENGKVRPLGIPTVVDRFVQQAISQVLTVVYEPQFSDDSFGFRPGRSAHDALRRVQEYADAGYRYCVDLDLASYFDSVNHSKLIQVLSETVKDGRVVSLIHKYLNAGVQIGERFEETPSGVPQGGPLSPLLGNIMLNELDKELERRGLKFVRYADDCLILVRTPRAAERVKASISRYIEEKLLLKVNEEKTVTGSLKGKKFLGYSFYT